MKSPSVSEFEKEFLFNAQSGAVIGVKDSLKRDVNINAHNNMISGNTALHFAVMGHCSEQYADDNCPYLKITKILLKNGADINFPNYYGVTPLHLALLRGKLNMVQLLLTKESDFNNKILNGDQCDFDAHQQIQNIVDFLLRNFLISSNEYPILLQFALRHEDAETFEMILNMKVEFDINAILPTMNSAIIHLVVQKGTIKMVQDLIDNGVDIERKDIYGNSPIHEAIREGKLDHFDYLLQNGASVFSENYQGWTALHTAAEYQAEDKIIDMILEQGIDVNIRSYMDGKTPLHVACSKLNNLETVKFLVQNGADYNRKDLYGETPLHMAMKCYVNEVILEYLLDLNADVNIQNVNGDTPLSAVLLLTCVNNRKLKILVAHIAILIANKSKVCVKNLRMIEHNLVKDYYQICNSEICKMNEKICSTINVSYLDLFTMDTQTFFKFIRKKEVIKVLNSGSYLGKFRIYGDLLQRKINRVNSRDFLLQQIRTIFNFQLKFKLSNVLLNKIVSRLNENELHCFVDNFLE